MHSSLLLLSVVAPVSTLLVTTVPRVSRHRVPKCALPDFEAVDQTVALREILTAANLTAEPVAIEEMSAGFCNWVYRVDLPGTGPVIVKLFSPLAQMRLAPDERGAGDEEAGVDGLGPKLLYRCADGLICDFVDGDTLTESDMHTGSAALPTLIAPRLAALHGDPLPPGSSDSSSSSDSSGGGSGGCPSGPVQWEFLHAMIEQIAKAPHALPPGFTLAAIRAEVERMRTRCEALELPVVRGHGDLKPSNVMRRSARAAPTGGGGGGGDGGEIVFIDFELAGRHYRGYDTPSPTSLAYLPWSHFPW